MSIDHLTLVWMVRIILSFYVRRTFQWDSIADTTVVTWACTTCTFCLFIVYCDAFVKKKCFPIDIHFLFSQKVTALQWCLAESHHRYTDCHHSRWDQSTSTIIATHIAMADYSTDVRPLEPLKPRSPDIYYVSDAYGHVNVHSQITMINTYH